MRPSFGNLDFNPDPHRLARDSGAKPRRDRYAPQVDDRLVESASPFVRRDPERQNLRPTIKKSEIKKIEELLVKNADWYLDKYMTAAVFGGFELSREAQTELRRRIEQQMSEGSLLENPQIDEQLTLIKEVLKFDKDWHEKNLLKLAEKMGIKITDVIISELKRIISEVINSFGIDVDGPKEVFESMVNEAASVDVIVGQLTEAERKNEELMDYVRVICREVSYSTVLTDVQYYVHQARHLLSMDRESAHYRRNDDQSVNKEIENVDFASEQSADGESLPKYIGSRRVNAKEVTAKAFARERVLDKAAEGLAQRHLGGEPTALEQMKQIEQEWESLKNKHRERGESHRNRLTHNSLQKMSHVPVRPKVGVADLRDGEKREKKWWQIFRIRGKKQRQKERGVE